MSIVNIQGTDIDFNIQIVSAPRVGTGDVSRSSIDAGGISYLEIVDNLIELGTTGHISFRNNMGILDRTKLIRDSEKTYYVDISIEDTQSKAASIVDKRVSFLGLVENNSSITTNILDEHSVMKFEEAQTSILKKTSLHKLLEKNQNLETNVPKELPVLIKDLLNAWVITIGEAEVGQIANNDLFTETGNTVKAHIATFWSDIESSVYDVIYNIYNACLLNNAGKMPLLKVSSFEESGSINRLFTLQEMFTDRHREFIKKYKTGISADFSDVYLEGFAIVPETNTNPQNTSFYSEVEDYDLLRADIETARDDYWGDYFISSNEKDLTKTTTQVVKFKDIVDEFERNDLETSGTFANIPALPAKELKYIKKDQSIDTPGVELAVNQVTNKVKKSLLFLNDTIVFKTKGQLYRKPGMFISIKGGEAISDPDSPKGDLWFVISIKHQFREMDYENEITAVRVFGNKKPYPELVGDVDLGK